MINKAREFTQPSLQDFEIVKYFEFTIRGDDTARRKPDPLPLLSAAEQMQVSPRKALMAGDSASDVKAPQVVGFRIICLSYGYNHGEYIRSYGPDAVIDSMIQLNALI